MNLSEYAFPMSPLLVLWFLMNIFIFIIFCKEMSVTNSVDQYMYQLHHPAAADMGQHSSYMSPKWVSILNYAYCLSGLPVRLSSLGYQAPRPLT